MTPERTDSAKQLLDALRGFLAEDGWPLAFEDEDERATAISVEGNNGRWLCVAQVLEERAVAIFSSVLPAFVPPERRAAVGEFLHRANAGLLLGGFQYDWDEGEIRYVTSLDLSGVDLAPLLVQHDLERALKQIVYVNISTVDQYLPGLMGVIYAGLGPQTALDLAEKD